MICLTIFLPKSTQYSYGRRKLTKTTEEVPFKKSLLSEGCCTPASLSTPKIAALINLSTTQNDGVSRTEVTIVVDPSCKQDCRYGARIGDIDAGMITQQIRKYKNTIKIQKLHLAKFLGVSNFHSLVASRDFENVETKCSYFKIGILEWFRPAWYMPA